ncbi:uncharacterized protein A4U43_C05F23420 [Asparagus officinalis]|uniref:CST complex subunit CTC1 n=1 Tax=Asparagus officinalis TaxID=4686 RepID=A0A5P1EV91_ASPOF|nr:uncharacterized protein A4U43_C05F23420 [Asparagus officinalis]
MTNWATRRSSLSPHIRGLGHSTHHRVLLNQTISQAFPPPKSIRTKKLKSLPNPNPNPRSFSPNHPVLLIGTVDLQTPEDCDGTSCGGHCFSFSDASSRVCCSIVDPRDLSFVGRKIHVLAWNFLPFKHKKGVLEIARWMLPASVRMSADPNPEPSFSAPMRPHSFTSVGALKSISPIFSVPCKNRVFDGKSTGFLAEILTCGCDRCCNFDNFDIKNPALDPSEHSFVSPNFVYFLKPACKWRPVMNLLVGKLIVISGLRKKKIVVRKDVTHEMFLSTEWTVVSLCQLPLAVASILKDEEVYNGVVTGVYMNGMAVELDSKVWLVLTEKGIPPPHSVRVGAIISVKNFHHLHLKFSWIEMHLLGTFARTSIDVKSFSVAHTRSYVRAEGQRMLGRFIESLTPCTKFWMLLLISCFRRKFAKMFSNEEILGSKNQEGLAQVYARRYLDSHFFQSQHGIFMEFFEHGEYTCEKESSMSSLKLVTPISNLISKCEALWASKISKAPCNAETFHRDDCGNCSTSKVASCCCTIRRVISSEDLGCILMGTLKVSPPGSLQLVDATGSIDAVIPDLLSDISYRNIYEVKNYKLIMEGSPVQSDCMGLQSVEAFSCKNIFDQLPLKKVLDHLTVYVVFYLRDSYCLNVPFQIPTFNMGNDVISITGGTTQLLLVTHKFPAIKNVSSGAV